MVRIHRTNSNDRDNIQESRGTPSVERLRRGQTIQDGLEELQIPIRSQSELKHKLVMFTVIPGLNLLAIYLLSEEESARYKIMSVAAAIFTTAFTGYLVYLIGSSSHLHRMKLITTRFQPYGHMIFPTQIKHYPSRPIKSVSEMLALRGSSIHIFFVFMGMGIACVTATAVLLNWLDLQRQTDISHEEMHINYLEQAFAISSVFAFPMVGYFELDVHSPCLMFMHYVGVLCQVLAVWPFALQSSFGWCSIIMVAVSYTPLVVWGLLGCIYPNDLYQGSNIEIAEHEMRQKVHRISVHCLLSQTLGGYLCMVTLCAYLWSIQEINVSL